MADTAGFLSLRFIQSLLDVCRQAGITQSQLEQHCAVSLSGEDEDRHLSAAQYVQLMETAAQLCDDPFIGLHIGEAIKPGHFGVLGYACMSSANLGEALQRALRYQGLVSDICRFSFQIDHPNFHSDQPCIIQQFEFPFHQTSAQQIPPRQLAEENLAGMVSFARWISADDHPPLEVHFQHSDVDNGAEYQRIFRCPVLFNQPQTRLIFPLDYLQLSLPQADKTMLALMERHAEELLQKAAQSSKLSDQAASILAGLLQDGEPGLERLASAMKLSSRSLQRQLQAEQLSYQQLLEQVRQQLALEYIQQPQLSLTDIAFLLGFAEQSSFQRAFKRWTGDSPGRYRKAQMI